MAKFFRGPGSKAHFLLNFIPLSIIFGIFLLSIVMKDNNLPALQSLYVPTTKNDFYNVLSNAWDKNQAFVMYNYDFGAGSDQMRKVREALYVGFSSCAVTHPEYYTGIQLSANITGDYESCAMEIAFDSDDENISFDKLSEERTLAVEMADVLLDSFIDENANGHKKADISTNVWYNKTRVPPRLGLAERSMGNSLNAVPMLFVLQRKEPPRRTALIRRDADGFS
jgi:hypothetical protein